MKFYIKTLGCKVNQSEGDKLASDLIKRGLNLTDSSSEADLIFINTCTVTSAADSKARQLIGKIIRNTKGKVIVTGCGVDNGDSGLTKFKDVELVTQLDKNNLAQLFGSVTKKNGQISKRSRPLVKIQDGCDHKCSYCIVPSVRGSSKSISSKLIKEQVRALLDNGYQEIVLTGVDIGAYDYRGQSLDLLLNEILAMDKQFRVRLSSLEPHSVTGSLLDLYASEKRICSHIHLPLQSGSDRILTLMNRPYDIIYFLDLAKKIKSLRKDTAITTDVIVGFPGENEQDFEQSQQIIKNVGFAKVHVFPYSQRPGTAASNLTGQINARDKKLRGRELGILTKKISDDFKQNLVNKKAQVLIEGQVGNYLKGMTSNYCQVYCLSGDGSLSRTAPKGKLVNVKIDNYEDERLFGRLIADG